MNIDDLIKEEAPDEETPHDKEYAIQLRRYYDLYKDLSVGELKQVREAFCTYNNSHWDTARRVVSYELLKGPR